METMTSEALLMRRLAIAFAVASSTAFVLAQTQAPERRGSAAAAPHSADGAKVEQTSMGAKPEALVAASFDGIGVGMTGPQGPWAPRNPSDNSLAVGPNHIVQIVNSRLAIFS